MDFERGKPRGFCCAFQSVFIVVAGLSCWPSSGASALTLDRVIAQAEMANATLRSAQATLSAAVGEQIESRAPLWNNPVVGSELLRRSIRSTGEGPAARNDWALSVSQTFETGGQPRARRDVAEQNFHAVDERIRDLRLQIRAEAEQRFVQILSIQERVEMETRLQQIAQDAAAMVAKRVSVGEDSKLDGNVARVEAERAKNQLAALQEQRHKSRAELAKSLQVALSDLPDLIGNLESSHSYTLEALLESAAKKPAARMLDAKEQMAASRLALERAVRYPDVTVGMSRERDTGISERTVISTLSVSLPLPLFRRNQAGIGRAQTELAQARVEREAGQLNARNEVLSLWQRSENLQLRWRRLVDEVLPRLAENERLSVTSYRVGEISLAQLLLVQRQVLDGRRDALDAQTEMRLTQIELEMAAGWHAASLSDTGATGRQR